MRAKKAQENEARRKIEEQEAIMRNIQNKRNFGSTGPASEIGDVVDGELKRDSKQSVAVVQSKTPAERSIDIHQSIDDGEISEVYRPKTPEIDDVVLSKFDPKS